MHLAADISPRRRPNTELNNRVLDLHSYVTQTDSTSVIMLLMLMFVCPSGERHVAEIQTSGFSEEETNLQSLQGETGQAFEVP